MTTLPRQRIRKTTTRLPNGTAVVHQVVVAAPELEWKLQAASVRAARQLPGFGDKWEARADGTYPTFTLAGDFAAGRRSRQESTKAKATGLVPGETDSRWYFLGARLKMIEYKAEKGRLSPEQKIRHALLRGLGFEIVVVRAGTEEDAAQQTLAHIRRWLAECGAGERGGAAVSTQAATHVTNDNGSQPAGAPRDFAKVANDNTKSNGRKVA